VLNYAPLSTHFQHPVPSGKPQASVTDGIHNRTTLGKPR
jgi:hypothetical protein